MLRRFFQRDEQGQTRNQEETIPANAKKGEVSLQEFAARAQSDGVRRMVIRAGNQPLPEDPNEQLYDQEIGDHAELANIALQAQDFKRSIYHLALALASNPIHKDWLALLDQWITATGSHALDFVPLDDKYYFATLQVYQQFIKMQHTSAHPTEAVPVVGKNYHTKVAVHAYILATQGNIQEAGELFLQLSHFKPTIPYGCWLPRWQNQPHFTAVFTPEKIAAIALQITQNYPGTYVFSAQGQAEIHLLLPLLRKTYTDLSGEPTSKEALTIAFVYIMALRKTGAFEEALRVTKAIPVKSYQSYVSLAMAEEAVGHLDASIAAYRQALTFEPDDVAVRNDLGNLFLRQGNLEQALRYYEESAHIDPQDSYRQSLASIAYLKYLQNPDAPDYKQELKKLARTQGLAHRLAYFTHASYIGKLPYPAEAIVNVARRIKPGLVAGTTNIKRGQPVILSVTSLESPSARLATEGMITGNGYPCVINVADVLSPDPREPLRPVDYQIWHYQGMTPIPAVPPPDPALAARIATLAQTPYALDRWYADACTLAQDLTHSDLIHLLAIMVHPPALPTGWDEWDWLTALQIASALTIASLDSGWDGSLRKAALTSLIYGPSDWSGAAALIATAVLARQDMHINIEFDRICRDLWQLGPGTAEWPIEKAMVLGSIYINNYSDETQNYLNHFFQRQESEQK